MHTKNVTSTSKTICHSKMSFVDLAGSDRATAMNENMKDRIREPPRSTYRCWPWATTWCLLQKWGSAGAVPGFELTHILKDSLGEKCRTLMILAVSSSKLSYTDKHNTVKYAERAMGIEQQAQKNALNVSVHKLMYNSLIEEYKENVEGLQRKLDEVRNEKSELEAQVVELKQSLATAQQDALLQMTH
ncbi:hypothetical protein HPB51_029218 [Rhipicephalus microplus]|uniref:Kinesin motor domain-containing protein n=1 Tax=Rhipicephalus microplus TaxID=6941 RepID=A0A9J6CV92_RHIMP|nr:hypothetical protein HPB51_029218 [Rhipicephalus microplus]